MKLTNLFEGSVGRDLVINEVGNKRAFQLLNTHCKNALWMLRDNRPLWRGMRVGNSVFDDNNIVCQINTKFTTRISENTSNYYTVLLDTNPHRDVNLPLRSKSIICSSDSRYADEFGDLYAVIPFDSAKIGETRQRDIWNAKYALGNRSFTLDNITDFLGTYCSDDLAEIEKFSKKLALSFNNAKYPLDINFRGDNLYPRVLHSLSKVGVVKDNLKMITAPIDPDGLCSDLIGALYNAFDPKKLGFVASNSATVNTKRNQECWVSGECVLVPKRIWNSMVKEYSAAAMRESMTGPNDTKMRGLNEAIATGSNDLSSDELTLDELKTLIRSKCKNSLRFITGDGPLYKGFHREFYKPVLIDTGLSTRKSENTSNYYTVLLDNNPHRPDSLPLRSKSIICTTNYHKAKNYGNVVVILPFDDAKIGETHLEDIWDVGISFGSNIFGKITNLNKLFARLGIEDNIESFKAFSKKLAAEFSNLQYPVNIKQQRDETPLFYDVCREFYPNAFFDEPELIKPWNPGGIFSDFSGAMFDAYDPKKLGFTASTSASIDTTHPQECWVSGKCLAIPEDVWRELITEHKNLSEDVFVKDGELLAAVNDDTARRASDTERIVTNKRPLGRVASSTRDIPVYYAFSYKPSPTSTEIIKTLKGKGSYHLTSDRRDKFLEDTTNHMAAELKRLRLLPDIIVYPHSSSPLLKDFGSQLASKLGITSVITDAFDKDHGVALPNNKPEAIQYIKDHFIDHVWFDKKLSAGADREHSLADIADSIYYNIKKHGQIDAKSMFKQYGKFVKGFLKPTLSDEYALIDKRVMVVDDVLSSGSTMSELFRLVKDELLAKEVFGVVLFNRGLAV